MRWAQVQARQRARKRRYHLLRARGLCGYCGAAPVPGRALCAKHRRPTAHPRIPVDYSVLVDHQDLMIYLTVPVRHLVAAFATGFDVAEISEMEGRTRKSVTNALRTAAEKFRRLLARPSLPAPSHSTLYIEPNTDVLRQRADLYRFLTRESRSVVRRFIGGERQVDLATDLGVTKETITIMLNRARRRLEAYEKRFPVLGTPTAME